MNTEILSNLRAALVKIKASAPSGKPAATILGSFPAYLLNCICIYFNGLKFLILLKRSVSYSSGVIVLPVNHP